MPCQSETECEVVESISLDREDAVAVYGVQSSGEEGANSIDTYDNEMLVVWACEEGNVCGEDVIISWSFCFLEK